MNGSSSLGDIGHSIGLKTTKVCFLLCNIDVTEGSMKVKRWRLSGYI